ncbi:hypothetical protein [Nitratiruptor sp. YY09-18]|uniref:hypothetical protein n=1 Tax=Nitratiruptor sp. YY09-18 TaxID=2724901 RepID=UPI0019151423|nr:hypothetical protein [Nitratiruptor sp. YY09-18]BCD68908.1 hypothetical protein NitYY0918_C1827 [Nitratiruptor sp. YY09-18]
MSTGISLLEKQILALHYNGTYITNFDFKKAGEEIGIEVDLADREKMLKYLLKNANEAGKMPQLAQALATLMQKRIATYNKLLENYPNAKDIIVQYIQKTRSTIMLLQQRARMNPYE